MMSYSYDEARMASLVYFGGDELAADVFVSKYALRSANNALLECSPDDMHRRLAKEFARIEARYPNPMSEDSIYELFVGFKRIVAQGSPMSGIGNTSQVQSLSNCFIISSPLDSYGSIARADEEILQIQKRRGGVGVDLSNIRPRETVVYNAARTADGIPIFMERYSNTTREVAQGGRRGALMETLDVRHPDIELFVDTKLDGKKVTGANVSTRITDAFMEAVIADEQFMLQWPVNVPFKQAKVTRAVRARDLWSKIIHAAWKAAEPGVLYWDTVLNWSMADEFADKGFRTTCTNPCSELPLSAYDSCRLLLINVLSYVQNPFLGAATFDFEAFNQDAMKAQRLMDDLVDLEIEAIDRIIDKVKNDPEPAEEKSREMQLWKKIRKACVDGRRTGTGVTAIGDAVAAMGLTYGSPESVAFVEVIYQQLAVSTHVSSVQMAKERGAFPAWEPGRYKQNLFAIRLRNVCTPEVNQSFDIVGRRNIALTTTAPAGSVSILTQTTSGIEPVYLLKYKRRKKLTGDEIRNGSRVDFTDRMGDNWQEHIVYHPGVKRWMDVTNKEDIEQSPYWKATSNDVDWLSSVDLLAAAQKWTEHSISKTINLPSTVTEELVSEVYMRAWKLGIKGVTVYRDGSRSGVLIDAGDKKTDEKVTRAASVVDHHAPTRPHVLPCDIHRVKIKGEQYLVLVGMMENRPYEVFAGLSERIEVPRKSIVGSLIKNGKKDGVATYNLSIPLGDDELVIKDVVSMFDNPMYGAFTRTISLAVRHGVPVQYLVEQLRKDKHSDMQSFNTVIARVLKGYIPDGTKVTIEKTCPECKSANLSYQQGCATCLDCGNSKCG